MGNEPLTVLVTARQGEDLPEKIRRLAPQARVVRKEDLQNDPSLIGQVDVVYGSLPVQQFPHAGRLKWVQTTGAGVGWTQQPAVLAHPTIVTNARIHAVQISEHLFGLLLMLQHRLHTCCRNQMQHVWKSPGSGDDGLPSRRLCVLGLGVIGRRCAMLGRAFGMRVSGVRRHPQATEHVERVLGPERLNDALAEADVIMNLLPGTSATEKMIGREQFGAMPSGAILLNAGRGSTVDTSALVDALAGGRLGGAALDVVDPEPLPPDHPLWDMPNVILTPHCSGGVANYAQQTERLFLDNLQRFLAGLPLENLVDKQEGY